MPALRPDVDPDGLLEYSVVYTDRSLNHMSQSFQQVMRELSRLLKRTYNAHSSIILPGSGTFGMEAVARQFATDARCLIVRNGWFSYRWTQILDQGRIAAATQVLKARRQGSESQSPFAPAPIDEVVAAIHAERPAVVFAPHVETSAGVLLPDDYLRQLAEAAHAVDGLLVLDCIASGTAWVDMQATGVDVLISAPQKGWSASPCCAMVMLSERARAHIEHTSSSSFAADLKRWLGIMETYENGGHAYHATLPTDGLTRLYHTIQEMEQDGFDTLEQAQWTLGRRIRALLAERGYPSVAAAGFEAPGVVVSYTRESDLVPRFAAQGVQIAAGVPLMCNEGDDFQTFRIGLFGLDKLEDIDGAVSRFAQALDAL
ncbi:aminotransferase class V-fold PLP-dependent enzyme [Salinicola endophyticus]|uniref:Aminotransferase class V-fold PLP-dependent enzyme n=1 Tax=Salinicola endophyticus TaxID=1949083 RepID=A0AB74U967_9GAMM